MRFLVNKSKLIRAFNGVDQKLLGATVLLILEIKLHEILSCRFKNHYHLIEKNIFPNDFLWNI